MLFNCGVGDDSWESLGLQADPTSPSWRRSVLGVHWKDWWSWNSNTFATWFKSWLIWKDPDTGKDWGQEDKGMTEDEMVPWHHRHNGHGFGWTLGVGDGQGGLACWGSWSRRELEMTEGLSWIELKLFHVQFYLLLFDSQVCQETDKVVCIPTALRIFHSLLWPTQSKALA